ncbi:TadE/TadG family type IV pilus assembly protein [Phytohabitans sp. LJ34]|uniref:TadE/TadG family type IV pilus assembly protein n=1 Tax=Phytohabitans sp. LJ34 TaxID=3452217 RepID=UPI003F89B6B7
MTASARRAPGTGDQGSVSVEIAILAPAFLMLIVLAAVAGRTAIAQNAVDLAAHEAARTASLARTAAAAETDGESAANSTLDAQGLDCGDSLQVAVDTSGFAADLGEPATVTATVSCTVSFADLVMPGVPGAKTVVATYVSPLDRYRSRG